MDRFKAKISVIFSTNIVLLFIVIIIAVIIPLSATANVYVYNLQLSEKHYVKEPINGYVLSNRDDLKNIVNELDSLNLTYSLFSLNNVGEVYYLSNDPNSVIKLDDGDVKLNGYTYKQIDINNSSISQVFINTDFNKINITSIIGPGMSIFYDVFTPVFDDFYYIIFVIIVLLLVILSLFMAKKSSNFMYVYSLHGFSKLKIAVLVLKNNLIYLLILVVIQATVFYIPVSTYLEYFTDYEPVKISLYYLLFYNLVFIVFFTTFLIVIPLTKTVDNLRKEVTNV